MSLELIKEKVHLLKPVGHDARVEILLKLEQRPKTYSELKRETGLSDGDIFYHLAVLGDYDLIKAKRGSNTTYLLTDQGRKAIDLLKKL